jgi:hypothetical protein
MADQVSKDILLTLEGLGEGYALMVALEYSVVSCVIRLIKKEYDGSVFREDCVFLIESKSAKPNLIDQMKRDDQALLRIDYY